MEVGGHKAASPPPPNPSVAMSRWRKLTGTAMFINRLGKALASVGTRAVAACRRLSLSVARSSCYLDPYQAPCSLCYAPWLPDQCPATPPLSVVTASHLVHGQYIELAAVRLSSYEWFRNSDLYYILHLYLLFQCLLKHQFFFFCTIST